MLRYSDSFGRSIAFLCVIGIALLTPLLAQGVNTLQPQVTDWHHFHQKNDAYWAKWMTATSGRGVSASDVRSIRLAAGIGDDEPNDVIVRLQAGDMLPDKYLLLTERPGACLRAAVYARGFRDFKEIWSSDAFGSAVDICQQPGCPESNINVDEKHRIYIGTYSRSTPNSPVCDQVNTTVFEPKGDTFELQDRHTDNTKCWVGYSAGQSAALWKATGPAVTVAIVEVLPSFSKRYALALLRNDTGAHVLRLDWTDPGSPFIGALNIETASECYSQVASVRVKITDSKIPNDIVEKLIAALKKIDLRSDRCVRDAEGECTGFFDGTYFRVEIPGHAEIQLFDLEGEKGYVSENPELSQWIYELLEDVMHPKEATAN